MMETFCLAQECNYVAKLEMLHEFAQSFLESDHSKLSFLFYFMGIKLVL